LASLLRLDTTPLGLQSFSGGFDGEPRQSSDVDELLEQILERDREREKGFCQKKKKE
jgi:hypothetical protein